MPALKAALLSLALLLAALGPQDASAVHLRAAATAASHHKHEVAASEEPEQPEGEEAAAEEAPADDEATGSEEGAEGASEEELPEPVLGECQAVDLKAPELVEVEECVCEDGHFWNWRMKRCSRRAPVGYECGFYPQDLHPIICAQGLICKAVDTHDHYVSHGRYKGQAGSHPAHCVRCKPEDNCPTSPPDCDKKVPLEGDICVSVRIPREAPPTEEADEGDAANATAATSLIMTGRRHHRHHKHHRRAHRRASDEPAQEDEEAAETPAEAPAAVQNFIFSKATVCVSVARAKQLLGVTGIDHFDMKAAKEIIETGEKRALQEACQQAEHAEPEMPEAAAEAPAEESAEHAEEGEAAEGEAPAEGEAEAPAEEEPPAEG